jgi:hypothetical protein
MILLGCFHSLTAQRIQTIVPKQVIVVGTAFQIQYIITEPSGMVNMTPPSFDSLQVVSGPNYYKGNATIDGKPQPIQNITYTLIASKTGSIKIGSLTAYFKNGIEQKSEQVSIDVSPKPKASYLSASSYTDISLYAPTSAAGIEKLIAENLFIKTEVSKTSCVVGEPLVATFTLYSRVQGSSEVINSPSLYGFTVMDMLNVNEAHQSVKAIGNKIFNTSILRKLQLYPEQAGDLVIDEMQLNNEIEFGDSLQGGINKVEKLLASNPVKIKVKPLPPNKPDNFTGAVGSFFIDARLAKQTIAANQQGRLIVKISGKGNFIQFAPPSFKWPKKFDVFDPVINDNVNRNAVPLEGSREYIFNFVIDSVGEYKLPPISFSFFDLGSRSYKTVSTDSIMLQVVTPVQKQNPIEEVFYRKTINFWIIALAALLVFAALVLVLHSRKKKPVKKIQTLPGQTTNYLEQLVMMDLNKLSDKEACAELQKISKKISKEYDLPEAQKRELQSIQNDCSLLVYSEIESGNKKEELKLRLIRLVQSIQK